MPDPTLDDDSDEESDGDEQINGNGHTSAENGDGNDDSA